MFPSLPASEFVCQAEARLPHRAYGVAISPGKEMIAAYSRAGSVTVLSGALRVIGTFEVGRVLDDIAVSPAGERLGLSLRDRILLTNAAGGVITEIEHPAWHQDASGACHFSAGANAFWIVQPSDDPYRYLIEIYDWKAWRSIASGSLTVAEPGGSRFVEHPSAEVIGVWIGAGQDGQWLHRVRWTGQELSIEAQPALERWTTPPVFDPSGREFLAMDTYQGSLLRYRYPSGEIILELSEADTFPRGRPDGDSDSFGASMAYLSDRRAAVLTANERILVIDIETMTIDREILLPGHTPWPRVAGWGSVGRIDSDVESFHLLSGPRLLAVHDRTGRRSSDYQLKIWSEALPLFG
jgi:hypothetical protein